MNETKTDNEIRLEAYAAGWRKAHDEIFELWKKEVLARLSTFAPKASITAEDVNAAMHYAQDRGEQPVFPNVAKHLNSILASRSAPVAAASPTPDAGAETLSAEIRAQLRQLHCIERITQYLNMGGLFNPEMALHDEVRNLLVDCRTELESSQRSIAAKDKEIAGLMSRVRDGEGSENCPFCHVIQGTGHSQGCPICHLCEVESALETAKAEVETLKQFATIDGLTVRQWKERAEREIGYSSSLESQIADLKSQLAVRQKRVTREIVRDAHASISRNSNPTYEGWGPMADYINSRIFPASQAPTEDAFEAEWKKAMPEHSAMKDFKRTFKAFWDAAFTAGLAAAGRVEG